MHRIRFIRGQRRELYPPGYRCVTRITRWGNPYKVADHGRENAVRLYRAMLERMTPDELLAALDALCKGIDESLYNVCTDLLVLENDFDDSEEDHDDDGKGT